jgi:hypothetical protein
MRPFVPILIGWHDAMVETAFDRAELEATGALRRRTRIPRWLRSLNGAEIAVGRALGKLPPSVARDPGRAAPGDRMVRPARIAVPPALGAVAAIHAAWALGWRWPGGTDAALAERVVGAGAELPQAPVIWAVAAALGASATVAAMVGAGRSEPLLRAGTWGIAAVLIARGAVFIPVDLLGGLDSRFARLDLALYSPLCLALGLGAAIVARGPGPSPASSSPRAEELRHAHVSGSAPCSKSSKARRSI